MYTNMANLELNRPKIARGLVLGKFMPPHAGHLYLCNFAKNFVDYLTILVCSRDCEPIPGNLRHRWMCEMFPDVRNVVRLHKDLPQTPEEHPDFWDIWKNEIFTSICHNVDYVFASEEYGHKLAEILDAEFIPVDIKRENFSVSGTKIRENPAKYWEDIPEIVRPYYTKHVCLMGPESTGKTELAYELSAVFETEYVGEYGRTYCESLKGPITEKDLNNIWRGHIASTKSVEGLANEGLLIHDTDPVMTAAWYRMLGFEVPAALKNYEGKCDLYFLTNVDTPWVDDGTRLFKNTTDRQKFFNICKEELQKRNLPYVILSGSWQQRRTTAIQCIKRLQIDAGLRKF